MSFTRFSALCYGSEPAKAEKGTPLPEPSEKSKPLTSSTNAPLAMNYALDQVENTLEKTMDKQYKIDWDFELVYHDDQVFVTIEYDQEDTKTFNKLSSDKIHDLVKAVVDAINKGLKKDMVISGIIIMDDAKEPTYTFQYQEGRLDIK